MSEKLPEWVELLDVNPSKAFQERDRLVARMKREDKRKRHIQRLKDRIAELQKTNTKNFNTTYEMAESKMLLNIELATLKLKMRIVVRRLKDNLSLNAMAEPFLGSLGDLAFDRKALDEYLVALHMTLDREARSRFAGFERDHLAFQMEYFGWTKYPDVTGDPNGERTSGDMICKACQQYYCQHPFDWRVIGYGGAPFLNVLCDGGRVKL